MDSIEPVPPAIALEQKNGVRNARSTVGTQTEIYDSLRLLFAHGGTTFCPDCGLAAVPGGVDRAVEELSRAEAGIAGRRSSRPSPGVAPRGQRPPRAGASAREDGIRVAELKRAGFFRALSPGGETVEIADDAEPLLDARGAPAGRRRALRRRRGVARRRSPPRRRRAFAMAGSPRRPSSRTARGRSAADSTAPPAARDFRDPTPAALRVQLAARGLSRPARASGGSSAWISRRSSRTPALTLSERPVAAWNTPAYESAYDDLFRACRRYSVRTDVPVARLSAHEREVLIKGRGEFYGVNGFFDWLETKRYKIHVRVLLARYRAYTLCPDCRGGAAGARVAVGALPGPDDRGARGASALGSAAVVRRA